MIRAVVDSRLRLTGIELEEDRTLVAELTAAFTHPNPDYAQAKHFGRLLKGISQTVQTWRDEGRPWLSFPRGGMQKVRSILRARSIPLEVTDNRSLGDPEFAGRIPPHRVELWPYQERVVPEMVLRENTLLRSSAGSGKTCALFAAIARVNLPTLVVVWNQRLLDQWLERIEVEFGVPKGWAGVIQGSTRRFGPITVGMQQTLWRCAAEVAPLFGVVACDEVQRTASKTFMDVVDQMPARYRFGVSDDERRADRKEFLIYDMFGDDPLEVTHKELVDGGYVADVALQFHPTDFEAPWWLELKAEIRALEESGAGRQLKAARRGQLSLFDRLLSELAGSDERNAMLVDLVMSEVSGGEQVLVMTHRREHALELDRLLNTSGVLSGIVFGGPEDKVESDRTVRRLKAGELSAAVGTYQAIGTGIDLPKVARGVFATPVLNSEKGRSQFKQYRGRFARVAEGKSEAIIHYPWDLRVFGERPLKHGCAWSRHVSVDWRGSLKPGREVLKEIRR